MKTLHFECAAGISGDMTLGALVDLGLDPEVLHRELKKLGLPGWSLKFQRDERCGIGGTRAIVDLSSPGYRSVGPSRLVGPAQPSSHVHRAWKDIRALIEGAGLTPGARDRALDIFTRIAVAEAQVHGVPVDDVAFHEVGALDSIVDIVGVAVGLDALAPERITASEIELGGGTVKCAHGVLPVPAPATLLLCQGLPVKTGGFNKEMTTPTGAAILASCVDEFVTTARFTEVRTGYGIGTRKLDRPNVLRVSWRDEPRAEAAPWMVEELVTLEANVDDMTGEALGFALEGLLEAGALDVTLTPCVMKKSRPGTVVSVLVGPDRLDAVRRFLFQRTTTIGFRETVVRRLSLPRRAETRNTDFGPVRTKTVFWDDQPLRDKIEFDDRARVARDQGEGLEAADRRLRQEGPR